MQNEISMSLTMAVASLMTASVMFSAAYMMDVRREYANAVENKYRSERLLKEYREFNKYDMGDHNSSCDRHIYGDQLIELIRNYYDTDLTIYVDKVSSTGSSLTSNFDEYMANKDKYSYANLQKLIPPRAEYHTYLVYDSADPATVTGYTSPITDNLVTGIRVQFIKEN